MMSCKSNINETRSIFSLLPPLLLSSPAAAVLFVFPSCTSIVGSQLSTNALLSVCGVNKTTRQTGIAGLSLPWPWLAVCRWHTCSCWASGPGGASSIRAGMSPAKQTLFSTGPPGEAYAALNCAPYTRFSPSGRAQQQ